MVYAKSRPRETLRAHTENTLEQANNLRRHRPEIEERIPEKYTPIFWELLDLVAVFHDLGKIHTPFQNAIRKSLGENNLNVPDGVCNIPHNLLSCAFLKQATDAYPDPVQTVIYNAIAWHHDRGQEFLSDDKWPSVIKAVKEDITVHVDRLLEMTDLLARFPVSNPTWRFRFRIREQEFLDEDLKQLYLFLKGFLHRADHSASAHVDSETERLPDYRDNVTSYILSHRPNAEIWQLPLARSVLGDNVVLEASTGSGKTEFALYWLDRAKGFYTLPVRTSVNAMFERIKKTLGETMAQRVGLIHSSALWYLLAPGTTPFQEEAEGIQTTIEQNDQSRQLGNPISVSTIDQLFTATFRYPGYEKIYSTLAYSKIVIDEIQSYDPDVAAVVLKGLVDTARHGGNFCLMTATLPTPYRDYLRERIPSTKFLPPHIGQLRKHRIKLIHSTIEEGCIDLVERALGEGKTLIIVNTVKKAQLLYDALTNLSEEIQPHLSVNLIHRNFTYKDRRIKENGDTTREGILNAKRGIWITTQLAEVSLNIDFPCLYTEMASADSIVQRMGRTNRDAQSDYTLQDPNVYVFTQASGVPSIYDSSLVQLSLSALENYDGSVLSQTQESELISRVYDPEDFKSTKPYQHFQASRKILEETDFTAESKSEAQHILRRISNVDAIPSLVLEDQSSKVTIENAMDMLQNKNAYRSDRIKAYMALHEFKLPVPAYMWWKYRPQQLRDSMDVFVIAAHDYSFERGLSNDPGSESGII